MGNQLTMCKCCCGSGPKIPEIKINVNSNCCRDNKKYVIKITDVHEVDKLQEVLKELHRSSIQRRQQNINLLV